MRFFSFSYFPGVWLWLLDRSSSNTTVKTMKRDVIVNVNETTETNTNESQTAGV